MHIKSSLSLGALLTAATAFGQTNDAYLAQFHPLKAPKPEKHFLHKGDRLAICGDSITEQKKYSVIMETYLTVCQPDLEISVRQYGWSGEKADGFFRRMASDCLRFNPTVATTCYGMNDHLYRPYEDRIGETYRSNTLAIVDAFKAANVRVILGSPGCVGKRPMWAFTNSTMDQLNLNLCNLRNIDIEIAAQKKTGFADVFWPMLEEGHAAQLKYGSDYAIAGGDGVHPDWAGHLVMAYAFLHSFGMDGDLGTFTVDLKSKKATTSGGHQVTSVSPDGAVHIHSTRYPFCLGEGNPAKWDNVLSGTKLVPFDGELNHLTLVVKHASAKSYKVTWGEQSHSFTADQLSKGINLAEEFLVNPFTPAFTSVEKAVAAKQAFETDQIKKIFHGEQGKSNMTEAVAQTEEKRATLVAGIKAAFVPVDHTLTIQAE